MAANDVSMWVDALRASFDLETLARHPATVYSLDDTLRVTWVNEGWHRFARDNDARPDCQLLVDPIGLSIVAVTPPAMRAFYARLFIQARSRLRGDPPARHVYECSTPTIHRTCVMHVYPVAGGGLLAVNSTLRELAHGAIADAVVDEYRTRDGVLTMCASCRRVRRADGAGWDFVPSWVEAMPAGLSHGLCAVCAWDLYGPLAAE
jgi:hypothetical protein